MPGRPLTTERALIVFLSAQVSRAADNDNHRPLAEDVAELLAHAGERLDLLSEATGLHYWDLHTSTVPRYRALADALRDLRLPDWDRWATLSYERRGGTIHTTGGFDPP